MISIKSPKDVPPPPNKLKLDKEVWTALWYLSLEMETTPEELIGRWVNKRLELKERIEMEAQQNKDIVT